MVLIRTHANLCLPTPLGFAPAKLTCQVSFVLAALHGPVELP